MRRESKAWRRGIGICAGAAFWAAVVVGRAFAIAPPFVPDEQLAERPVVVVARWDKSPLEGHHLIEGNVCKKWEGRGGIVIERVIRGEAKAGPCRILVGPFMGWNEEGGPVVTYTSTMLLGEAQEVAESNLWFLSRQRSWDATDTEEYLCLDTYRGVQPLALEPYFRALMSDRPQKEVPALLECEDPQVVLRVLEYVSGGELPWPFDPGEWGRFDRWTEKKRTLKPLREQASAVAELLRRKEPPIRGVAAAVYARLAGRKALPALRGLLSDEEPWVRGVAVCLLARQRDIASAEAINKAVMGFTEPDMACKAIKALEGWGNEAIVPALIALLQNDGSGYVRGDDRGVPALKARAALELITGYRFPLDTRISGEAWEKAKGLTDYKEHIAVLAQVAPCDPEPLVATVVSPADDLGPSLPKEGTNLFQAGGGDEGEVPADVVVRNRSKRNLVITRFPVCLVQEWGSPEEGSGISSTYSGGRPESRSAYVELASGESVRFRLGLRGDLVAASPATRRVALDYFYNGNEFGVNAWLGTLEAAFGEEWQEPPRVVEAVEERWPNGNLKCRGQLVNGKKHGLWTFYREDGKRIRETTYFNDSKYKETGLNPDYVGPGR